MHELSARSEPVSCSVKLQEGHTAHACPLRLAVSSLRVIRDSQKLLSVEHSCGIITITKMKHCHSLWSVIFQHNTIPWTSTWPAVYDFATIRYAIFKCSKHPSDVCKMIVCTESYFNMHHVRSHLSNISSTPKILWWRIALTAVLFGHGT